MLGNNSALELAQAATGATFHMSPAQTSAAQLASMSWFVALTLYTPDSQSERTEMDTGAQLSRYLRAAWMPKRREWETGLGFGVHDGRTRATTVDQGAGVDAFGNPPGLFNLVTHAWFVDAQLQGKLAERELGVYLMYASGDRPSTQPNDVNVYAGTADKSKSLGIDFEYSLRPHLALLASYGTHDDGSAGLSAKTNAGLGLYWKIHQNITLQPMYERFGGDQRDYKKQISITLESAF